MRSDKSAFLIALIGAAASGSIPLTGFFGGWDSFGRFLVSEFAGTVVLLPFAGVIGAILGLPVALLLRKYRRDNLPALVAIGVLMGGSISLLIFGPLSVQFDPAYYILAALVGAIPGLVAAICWHRFAEIAALKNCDVEVEDQHA